MITIFNRKELLVTYDVKKQSEVRAILQNYKIDYDVKVTNILGSSSRCHGSRAYTGSFGMDLNKSYEYKIYVKKSDYERSVALVNGRQP